MSDEDKKLLAELRAKKKKLLAEREQLLNQLKNKHADVYQRLLLHKIDPKDLRKFAAKISAAFVLATGAFAHTGVYAKTAPDVWPGPVAPLSAEELLGKTEEEKAALVWKQYGPIIKQVAQIYRIDPQFIFATIMVESMGNAYAIRYEPRINDASYGLGQVLYGTARLIGFEGRAEELYIPEVSIDLIGRYHRRNLDTYGEDLTIEQLATAYNAGSPYSYPTYDYVEKIMRWYNYQGPTVLHS